MPSVPWAKPCKNQACSNEAAQSGYCEACAQIYAPAAHKERLKRFENKITDPFYGSQRWKNHRKAYLSRNPLCKICEKHGRTTAAVVVDHIIPRQAGGPDYGPDSVFQGLCRACDAQKRAEDMENYGTITNK